MKFRLAIQEQIDAQNQSDGPIAGPGHRVQIDESNVGHWKLNRGNWTDGHWVFGASDEQTKQMRFIICLENQRNRASLEPIIRKNLLQGSSLKHSN